MKEELLKPESLTSFWLIGSIIAFCIIVLVLFLVFKKILKKPLRKKNNNILFFTALCFLVFLSCSNEKLDEIYDVNMLTSEYNLKIPNDSLTSGDKGIYFENAVEAKKFIKCIENGGTISIFAAENPSFLIENPKFSKYLVNYPENYVEPIAKSIPVQDLIGPFGFAQPYVSVMGMNINSLQVGLTYVKYTEEPMRYKVTCNLVGVTLGLGFRSRITDGYMDQGYNIWFNVEFAVDYVLFVEGIGRVYTGPWEVHPGRYEFQFKQGRIYQ